MRSRTGLMSLSTVPALLACVGCIPIAPLVDRELAAQSVADAQIHTWHDPARERDLLVHINLPDNLSNAPFPLIIFSHGVGTSGSHYQSLTQSWVNAGFIVATITHPNTDNDAVFGDRWFLDVIDEIITTPDYRVLLPADVSFVLDEIAIHPLYADLVNMQKVAAAGHSMGAYTALALGGMSVNLGDSWADVRDQRIRAVLALSPPGDGTLGISPQAFEPLSTPCMTIFGTLDLDPGTNNPEHRRVAYDNTTAPDQFLVTLPMASHGACDEQSPWLIDQWTYTRHSDSIEACSSAFLAAYTKNDAAAQTSLIDGTIETAANGLCTIESRNTTPLSDDAESQPALNTDREILAEAPYSAPLAERTLPARTRPPSGRSR